MQTLYFIFFCLGIGGIIFWCLRNDDGQEFDGQKASKFETRKIVRKKVEDQSGRWSGEDT